MLQDTFLVKASDTATTANGSQYARLTLTDGSKEYQAKRWNWNKEVPKQGSVIEVVAEENEFRGQMQLIIKGWKESDRPASDFYMTGPVEVAVVLEDLQSVVSCIQDENLRNLCLYVLGLPGWKSQPAATSVHHNYIGGLAQHTSEVTQMAVKMSATMGLKTDLVIAGAFLHDVGKLYTYSMVNGVPERTDVGNFMEHIVMGCMKVQQWGTEFKVPQEQLNLILHIIASHHGQLDWGSPVTPCIPEAMVVHAADLVSSKVTIMQSVEPAGTTNWSKFNQFLGSAVYKGDYYGM